MNDFEQILSSIDWHREPYSLYEPIAYTLQNGGKRLRPNLLLLAAQMYGSAKNTDADNAALAIEIFHNFTLLHDDVMDNADLRRSRPTVHRKWNTNIAILSGDRMIIEAYSYLTQISESKQPSVIRMFNKMASAVCEGQQLDMDFEKLKSVSIDQYINMIEKKTAVLIATALQIGAFLADARPDDLDYIYNYGINIGLAFQLQDDLLDTYGDEKTFGKPIGGDILEAKKTFLLLKAFEKANQQQKEQLNNLLTDTHINAQEKIAAVRDIYNALNIQEETENIIRHYTSLALEQLNLLNAAPQQLQQLRHIALQLMKREK